MYVFMSILCVLHIRPEMKISCFRSEANENLYVQHFRDFVCSATAVVELICGSVSLCRFIYLFGFFCVCRTWFDFLMLFVVFIAISLKTSNKKPACDSFTYISIGWQFTLSSTSLCIELLSLFFENNSSFSAFTKW